MAFSDLREYVHKLEELGELKRVKQEVDWKYEIGAWTRHVYDMNPSGPALLFENVKGYDKSYKVLTNAVGSHKRVAMALGIDPEVSKRELILMVTERLKGRIKPILVKTGSVQENVHLGKEINLFEFPAPWFYPRDGGRFIGTWHGVVSKDPETEKVNVGCYRVQVQDRDKCTIGFTPGHHMGIHFARKELTGDPLEVALVIGAEEAVPIISAIGIPYGLSEYEVVGGIRGQPLLLVKCNTVDLEVPADAEIVIEGKLHTDVQHRLPEGPFGEYLGYHGGGIRMRPMLEVTCIMHRNEPILRSHLTGKPPTESNIMDSIVKSAEGFLMFSEQGPAGVKAINNAVEAGGTIVTIIQMSPYYVGHSREVARLWLSQGVGASSKLVIIVDDDIDPFDLGQVFWALGSRTQGSRDVEVLKYCKTSRSDPSVPRGQGEYTDRMIIDATKKLDYPYDNLYEGHWAPVAVPPRHIMELVALKWRKEQGESVVRYEIERITKELQEVHYKQWEDWRDKHYVLTQEQKDKDLGLSYPSLTKGTFE